MDIQLPNTEKRRQRRAILAGIAVAGFALLLATAWSLANRPPAIDRDDIWTARVTRGELVQEVSATGTLVATELRAVTNRSEGVVEVIRVLPGHVVGPDDVLLEMSSPALEDDLADARYELAAAEADQTLSRMEAENRYLEIVALHASAEAEYTTSRLELEANEELGDERIASAIEIERIRLRTSQQLKRMEAEQARLDSYGEYLAAQEASKLASVSKLRERVARLESRVDDLLVRAGTNGVVQEINVEEGERLQPGHAIARVVNPSNLLARIRVSERDAALVKISLPVRLELGRDVLTGKVSRIDPTVRDRLVTVDVALESADHAQLRPDLSVIARIELQRLDDVLVLDRPVGLRDAYQTIELFRLDSDGDRARRVSVEVGGASTRQVEVVNGLDSGDVVVLADLSEWAEFAVLRIR
jgi:HlyD family secretion protein